MVTQRLKPAMAWSCPRWVCSSEPRCLCSPGALEHVTKLQWNNQRKACTVWKQCGRYKYKSKVLFKARIDSSILPLDDTLIRSNNFDSGAFFFFVFFTRLSSHTCGQKMAAEAAAGRCRCPQREPRELLAMKMNVWEQIRLFLGDLSLALYERESGWVWRLWRESERKQTQQEGRWRRKAAVVFFGEEGEKKNRLGGRTNDQVVTDMKTLHLSVGVEWRVQRMIWPIWSFWVTTDQGRRLCGDVVMSLAVEDPRGTPSLLNQTHTHTQVHTHKKLFLG